MTKEELFKEFDVEYFKGPDKLFDWFYSKLEEKETLIQNQELVILYQKAGWYKDEEIERLEAKLKAADEVIKPFEKLANECLHNSLLHKNQTVYAYNKAEITMEDLRRVEHYKSLCQ